MRVATPPKTAKRRRKNPHFSRCSCLSWACRRTTLVAKKMSGAHPVKTCIIDEAPPSKNRVMGLAAFSYSRAGSTRPETLETHQEIHTTDTTTASGILYWLTRDPAGEAARINLYGFAGNTPLLSFDAWGLAEQFYYEPIVRHRQNLIVVAGPDVGYGYAQADFYDVVGYNKRPYPSTPEFQARAFAKGFKAKMGESMTAQAIGFVQDFSMDDILQALEAIADNPTLVAEQMARCAITDVADITTKLFDLAKFYSGGDPVSAAHTLGELTGQYGDRVVIAALASGVKTASRSKALRSTSAKRTFLRDLADNPNTPRAQKQWLRSGRNPPGYDVVHIKPLSIKGADDPANMRLILRSDHRIHHKFYRPWED